MTTVSQIQDSEFDLLLESEPIFVIDFTAPWCGPCRKISPLIEQLAEAYQGRVKVLKIDIDKNKVAAKKYGVKSIPAVLIFKGGEVVENIVGVVPYENFVSAVEKHI
ncbi:thioredoxin [Cylindrospermum sp. FACHB-282]|uniref:thioredoxin n=1 Tax=Cylindrospermum sp. FACHB-282 TaxID=2692794 RepID=UPI0016840810|nr:thioredoxin [Cylindrospermum sp. FACHB-282]MBD2388610.1 thioredoxin [Cylindrospermum sp. FACHB-282]